MSLWGRIFAALYEPVLRVSERNGLADLRADMLAQARGRTLELGAGTGLNLGHYPAAVTELVLTEPEAPMSAKLEQRMRARSAAARVVRAGAEELPFADATRARRQERLTPLQRRVACGCHLDRATPAAITRAGFTLTDERHEHFPKAAKVLQPLAVGRATR